MHDSLFEEHFYMIFNDSISKNNFIFDETNSKENIIPYSSDITKIEPLEVEDKTTNNKTFSLPKFYSLDEIMNILSKICDNSKILDKLKNWKCIEESIGYRYLYSLNKEDKRPVENNISYISLNNNNGKKRGRKSQNYPRIERNKMAADNIIKKIKTKLFDFLLKFINLLLKKMNLMNKLLKLDSTYIDKLSRENELKLLETTLKDVLSLNISPKYKSKREFKEIYNKEVIDAIIKSNKIINRENDFNHDTLMFVLNMTFRDWFDLFTGKNNVERIANEYIGNQINTDCINFERIKESFVGREELLIDLANKSEDNYFAFFIFYLYNYERWFYIKSPREKRKNVKEK